MALARRHAFVFTPERLANYKRWSGSATGKIRAEGREPASAAAHGLYLQGMLATADPAERAWIRDGLAARGSEAIRAGLGQLCRGRLATASAWFRAAAAICQSPPTLARASLLAVPEQVRTWRGLDAPLMAMPAPQPLGTTHLEAPG
jgi:hypothetical protein